MDSNRITRTPFAVSNDVDLLRERIPLRYRCVRCASSDLVCNEGGATCTNCGTSYDNANGILQFVPADADRAMETYYDTVAANTRSGQLSYMPERSPHLEISYRNASRAIAAAIQRNVPAGSLVLDDGCGHGVRLAPLASRYRFVGIDLSLQNLSIAKTLGYDVIQGDARRLPFADEQFDAVVCAEVIQHFAQLDDPLAEMVRVCKPGGSVMISTMNRSSLLRVVFPLIRRILRLAQPMPLTKRRPVDFVRHDLALYDVTWIFSPAPIVSNARWAGAFAPGATNFVVSLRKIARS